MTLPPGAPTITKTAQHLPPFIPPTHKIYITPPNPPTSRYTMPLEHTVTYQAFRKITNFIHDNGNDWDEFCTNTARSTTKATKTQPSQRKASKHKTAKMNGHLAPKLFLQANPNRFVLFPIQHNNIWRMYK